MGENFHSHGCLFHGYLAEFLGFQIAGCSALPLATTPSGVERYIRGSGCIKGLMVYAMLNLAILCVRKCNVDLIWLPAAKSVAIGAATVCASRRRPDSHHAYAAESHPCSGLPRQHHAR